MNLEEFIKKLREKLAILEEKEIEDIIEEYTGYIEEKVQNGKTEEAIADFGDMDELVTELLKAYKINVEKNKVEKNALNHIADTFCKWVDRFISVFANKSGSEILKIIIELCIIFCIIAFCKLPFHILEELGYNVFMVFQNGFGRGLFRIWKFLIEMIYLIFGIVLFVKICEKRYFKYEEEPQKEKEAIIPLKKRTEEKQNTEKEQIKKEPRKGFIDFLATICIWFIKFIAIWILFGIGCYILAMAMGSGICIYFIIQGIDYFGIYLSVLMLLCLGVLAFIPLFNFIFNKKNPIKFLLIAFLTSFILLGIGLSYASVELATTEFINEIPNSYNKKIITENVLMNDNIIVFGNIKYELDESINDLKIEFEYYEDLYSLNPDIYEENNRVHIGYNVNHFHWNNKIFNEILRDLKEHRIYNYDMEPKITIYTNQKNIDTLRANKKNWQEQKYWDQEAYYDCLEDLREDGYESLSTSCRNRLLKLK
ncbi:MAG: dicarboxylate/amino acid:cation symporter [Bacilli bacterium]|nr:dicarboxylate/amino acid:cation symporter [Bacilli bacterium]